MLQDRLSANGTFVNEFFFRAKLVVHGDHIRVGRSVFVYLLEDEVDEALLKLTPAERHWSDSHYPPTKPMCKYLVDRDPSKLRAPERLYVAVTRARHSVTFVFPEIGEPLNRADD